MTNTSSQTAAFTKVSPTLIWASLSSAPPPNAVATYGDFVESMRRGEVQAPSNAYPHAIPALERKRNWAVPSFDFSALLDPSARRNLLHRLPSSNGLAFRPPVQDAAYICSVGPERRLLVVRWGVKDYPDDDEGPRFYYYRKVGNGPWVSADGDRDEWQFFWAAAHYLLQNPRWVVSDADPSSVIHANKRRRMAGTRSLPPTQVIRLTRRVRTNRPSTAMATGAGAPKSPHHRKGHFRRLRDGRVVPVKPCKIHAGAAAPQNFVVRP